MGKEPRYPTSESMGHPWNFFGKDQLRALMSLPTHDARKVLHAWHHFNAPEGTEFLEWERILHDLMLYRWDMLLNVQVSPPARNARKNLQGTRQARMQAIEEVANTYQAKWESWEGFTQQAERFQTEVSSGLRHALWRGPTPLDKPKQSQKGWPEF